MIKNATSLNNAWVLGLYILLSYPLFYFSYKFCLPDFGGQDFFSYYLLYDKWEFAKVQAPFNMRVISSYMIYLMHQSGLHYNTETVFNIFYPKLDQQVYFNAIFFNYITTVFTCFVMYLIAKKKFNNLFYAFCVGLLYLLGFGTLFFSLKPTSDALGVFLTALILLFYLKQSNWIYLVLFLSVFQREYIFFSFAILSFFDFTLHKQKYFLYILIASIVFFFQYYLLRKTFFFTPQFDYQTNIDTFIHSLLRPTIDWPSFIKQSFFISNLLLMYLLIILYKKVSRYSINRHYLLIIAALFIQVVLMSIMAQFGNNAGRYFYYTTPILLYCIAVELKPMLSLYLKFNDKA